MNVNNKMKKNLFKSVEFIRNIFDKFGKMIEKRFTNNFDWDELFNLSEECESGIFSK